MCKLLRVTIAGATALCLGAVASGVTRVEA